MERVASSLSYGAGTATVVFGITINEWGVIIGLVFIALTFAINWWYKHQTLKLNRKYRGK